MDEARLVPELLVDDLAGSLEFWCDVIGFHVVYDRPEEKFACLDLGGARFMLEQISPVARQWVPAPLEKPLGRGINFEIMVRNLEPIVRRLREAQWPLFMDVEEKRYRVGDGSVAVRQFLVQDPDGYLLRLSQTMPLQS